MYMEEEKRQHRWPKASKMIDGWLLFISGHISPHYYPYLQSLASVRNPSFDSLSFSSF